LIWGGCRDDDDDDWNMKMIQIVVVSLLVIRECVGESFKVYARVKNEKTMWETREMSLQAGW